MFPKKISDKTVYSKLKQLVKLKKNEEVKDIVRDVNPTETIHISGTTLLHLAAKYNNVNLMRFLISELTIDIDVQDMYGTTPLMTAVLQHNYKSIEFLLNNEARICIIDGNGESALQLAINNKVPKYVIKYFLNSLKNSQLTLDEMADILTRNEFPLKYLLLIEDSQLTRAILEKKDTINYNQSLDLVRRAMTSTSYHNVQNLKMMMRYGPNNHVRQQIFIEEMSYIIESAFPSKKYLTSMIRQLMNFNAFEEHFIRYLEIIFYTYKRQIVTLMLECRVDIYIKVHYGQDLLVYLFGNRKLDAVDIVMRDIKTFDVRAKARRGLTALHYAVKNKLKDNVCYLLDNGADPNVKDELGITPLFYAADIECLEILLSRGADVQICKSNGLTVLETSQCMITLYVIIAHIAVIEAQGRLIEQKTRDIIERFEKCKNFYTKCQKQIYWMKNQPIFNYATLFTVLTKRPEQLVPYMKNIGKDSELIDRSLCKVLLNRYYYFVLKKRLKKASKIYKLKCKASKVISESIKIFAIDSLVIDKIVSYLTYENLLAFK